MLLSFKIKPTTPTSCAGSCRRLLMQAGVTVPNYTAWASKGYSWTQKHVQSSKAPSKTQHQSVHLGSRFCWLCKCDRCYFVPAESHLTVGQSGGSLWREREEGKKEKRRQLPYTWVFERSTLFASPQAVILSDLKLSRARPGLVIAQENPQAGKKGGKALE